MVPTQTQKGMSRKRRTGKQKQNLLVPYMSPVLTDALTIPGRTAKVYTFIKASNTIGALTQSNSANNAFVPGLSLGTIVGDYTYYTSIFDQYRINLIEVILRPKGNVSTVNASASGSGFLYSVIDYDDATAVTPNQAMNYDNVITTSLEQTHRRCFVPHIALGAYSGSFTSYANETEQWIDCNSPTVAHYGVKYVCDAGTTGSLQSWDLFCRISVSFRGVR
jgi:hypothetical protein